MVDEIQKEINTQTIKTGIVLDRLIERLVDKEILTREEASKLYE